MKNTSYRQIRHQQILSFCIDYIKSHGYSPNLTEIADSLEIQAKSAVHKYVNEMLELGLLETDAPKGTSRAIRIPGYSFQKIGATLQEDSKHCKDVKKERK